MERTRAWLESVVKDGLAEVVGEGPTWATVRFFHHATGCLVHTSTVRFAD